MNGYQIVSEVVAWKKHLPNLSKKAIRKLRKSKIIKPEKDYLAGIEKGTRARLKRAGVIKTSRSRISDKIGPFMTYNKAGEKVLVIPRSWDRASLTLSKMGTVRNATTPKAKRRLIAIFKRHEADEALGMKNVAKKIGRPIDGVRAGYSTSHLPGVLSKEKQLTTNLSKMYGKKSPIDRIESGEDPMSVLPRKRIKQILKRAKETGIIRYLPDDTDDVKMNIAFVKTMNSLSPKAKMKLNKSLSTMPRYFKQSPG